MEWFKCASGEEIRRLERIDWGGGYQADRVAEHFARRNGAISALYDHLAVVNKRRNVETVGFEVYIDEVAALGWLAANKPDIFIKALG